MKKIVLPIVTATFLFAGGLTAGACHQPVAAKPAQPQTTIQVPKPVVTEQAPVVQQEKPVTTVTSTEVQQVLNETNAYRAQYGLAPLKVDAKVQATAQAKATDMAKNRYFSHTSASLGSPFDQMKSAGIKYRRAAENIAMGQRSAQEVVDAWMKSPGHRANILDKNLTHIGIGYDAAGRYWVQQFVAY